MSRILADTGPLAAYVQENEAHSAWTREAFDRLEAPFLTCEPVLTEACFLIERGGGDPDDLLDLVDRGLIQVRFELIEELPRVRALMKRYRNLPMSLADACLVRMTERVTACRVVTFDSHFTIYRRHDRRPIPVLMPPER
ncbi:MAG: PIN domain-containing protein [Verrucomicrobiota bacterium]|nr:PIN domain-containing protein [Verrucomicrobiota bacterium]